MYRQNVKASFVFKIKLWNLLNLVMNHLVRNLWHLKIFNIKTSFTNRRTDKKNYKASFLAIYIAILRVGYPSKESTISISNGCLCHEFKGFSILEFKLLIIRMVLRFKFCFLTVNNMV